MTGGSIFYYDFELAEKFVSKARHCRARLSGIEEASLNRSSGQPFPPKKQLRPSVFILLPCSAVSMTQRSQYIFSGLGRRSSLFRSLKQSDRERITPVALYKRATFSDSLFFTSESLFRSQKTSDLLKKTDELIPKPAYVLTKSRAFTSIR